MKNLNEPRKSDDLTTADIAAKNRGQQRPGDVIPFERGATPGERTGVAPLLPKQDLERLNSRWSNIQTNFVDEPRKAVEDADRLVAEAVQLIAQVFADERGKLEQQWSRGEQISTEDLRVALQHYRTFFSRLLTI